MVMKGNSLNLLFESDFANQQRLINYLKQSFTEEEIYSLGRLVDIDKDDYVGKGMTKQQLASAFVESLVHRSLFDKLFIFLQSPAYSRPRLYSVFSDFGFKEPLETEQLVAISKHCFDSNAGNIEHSSFSEWLEYCKKRMVLVLGKDNTPEAWSRLQKICEYLSALDYSPILIKQQPEIGVITNEEKMLAYASISRFIVIEKSEPAGQIDEAHICAINRFVSVWLREEGKGDTWMQGDYEVSYSHVKGFEYNNSQLEEVIRTGVEWAEHYLTKKEETLNTLYPFR